MLHVACRLVTAFSVFVKYFTHLPPKNCANTLPHRTERAQLVARLLAALHHNGWQLVSRLLPPSRCAKCRGILFNFIFIFLRFFFVQKYLSLLFLCLHCHWQPSFLNSERTLLVLPSASRILSADC